MADRFWLRAALVFVGLSALIVNANRPAPLLEPVRLAARPCMTDLECEARFGAGPWFPSREPAALAE